MLDIAKAGGPAFPRTYSAEGHNGMTLRDWFAGQIVAAAMTNAEGVQSVSNDLLVSVAAQAYRVADAMLVARGTQ